MLPTNLILLTLVVTVSLASWLGCLVANIENLDIPKLPTVRVLYSISDSLGAGV